MKKSLTAIAITLGLISLTGCSTGPGQPQIHKIQTQQKEVSIKLNFPKNDPVKQQHLHINKEIFDNLLFQIQNYMYKFSKYYKFHMIGYYKNSNSITKYAGIQINNNKTYYNINYKNGLYFIDTNDWYLTEVKFKIPYKINYDTNNIILNYPNQYILIPCNDAIGKKIALLDNPENLKKDVVKILNNLKNAKLYIVKKYILQGEINTNYPPNSIYANFKRLMGQYRGNYYWENSTEKISPIEKENTFNLKIKNKIYPLNIKVYPYRNGSKVVYKAYISYKVYSDGTSTLTRKDIENAKKEIEKVVND